MPYKNPEDKQARHLYRMENDSDYAERHRARSRKAMKKWRANHPDEAKRRFYEYREKNPELFAVYRRRHDIKRLYGISIEEWERMFFEQNGNCACCGKPFKPGRFAQTDHCHKTGKVRGLLCVTCNTTMGRYEDDPRELQKLLDYLHKHSPGQEGSVNVIVPHSKG